MAPSENQRPQRLCDRCFKLDDHPRHVAATDHGESPVADAVQLEALPRTTPPAAVAQVLDPTTTIRHIDCCAEAGCEQCRTTVAETGGKKGAALLAAIQGGK